MDRKNIWLIAGVVIVGVLVVLATMGTFGSLTKQPVRSYISGSGFGVAFNYPETSYTLAERTEGFEDSPLLVVTLIDKNAVVPDMSEGPTAISLIAASNASSTPLEEWVRTKTISNFGLSDGTIASTTVGGEPALRYQYTGLYESDAVAVAHDDNIYVFSVSWTSADDQMRSDFEDLLKSVTFR